MNRMKYLLAAFIWCSCIQFTACGTEGSPADPNGGSSCRAELTEEEMKGGHVSFQMDEKLIVDADVTPKEKYKNGLSSYYLRLVCETDKASEKKFLQAPTLSFHSFEEWEEMLNKILPGKFKDNAFQLNREDADIRQAYQGKDGNSYQFRASWSNYTKGVVEKTGFNAPGFCIDIGHGNASFNKAISVMEYVLDCQGSGKTGFQQDSGGNARQMKEFLHNMSGRPIYEGYDFSVVSRETIGMLNEVHPWMKAEEPEEEYAAFFFYYDIDGLPFKDLNLNYTMGNNETAAELCYWSSVPGNCLQGFSEHQQVLLADKEGIFYLDCSNMWDAGEVYKKNLPIVSPNEALLQVKEHYNRQLIKEVHTITDISLVYTGYFSDGADGKIQPVASPFWAVTVYDGDAGMRKYFVYDACTGECIREG